MRLAYLLATLIVLCAVVHALPVFTTKFVLPENTEELPEVTEKVGAYIENLIERRCRVPTCLPATLDRLAAIFFFSQNRIK